MSAYTDWKKETISNFDALEKYPLMKTLLESAFNAGLEAAAKVAVRAQFLDCVIDKQLATAELIRALKED